MKYAFVKKDIYFCGPRLAFTTIVGPDLIDGSPGIMGTSVGVAICIDHVVGVNSG